MWHNSSSLYSGVCGLQTFPNRFRFIEMNPNRLGAGKKETTEKNHESHCRFGTHFRLLQSAAIHRFANEKESECCPNAATCYACIVRQLRTKHELFDLRCNP